MKTIERPKTEESTNSHVSHRLPSKLEPEDRRVKIAPIPMIERMPVREVETPTPGRPYLRWLGMLSVLVLIAGGVTVAALLLDDDGTTTSETPWTPDSRGLTTATVEAPWTLESRGLTTATVEAPWTLESRGLR